MGVVRNSILVLGALAVLGGGAVFLHDSGGINTAPVISAPVNTPVAPTPPPPPVDAAPVAETPEPLAEIDVVRVTPDGAAVIGGTGRPGAAVEIILDSEAIWSGTFGPDGSFAALLDLPPDEGARTLWLRTGDGSGAMERADASVVLAPTTAPEPTEPETPATPEPTPPPVALATDAEGVRPVNPRPLDPTDALALDTVRYGADGEVILSGRSNTDDGELAIFLDGRMTARARISAQGDWEAILADVPSGDYRLGAQLTDTSGRVSRLDLPFRRESPATIQAARVAASSADQTAALLTVQPGFSLWGIARDRYGDGFQYVAVYTANEDQIADPDLIYPGQVLTLPALSGD